MRSLTRSSGRQALSFARSLSHSLSLLGERQRPLQSSRVAHVRVSQQYAHRQNTCMHVHVCDELQCDRKESKQAGESESQTQRPLTLSQPKLFLFILITTRALIPSSSNLSYSRLLLSGVCTHFLCHCLFACQHKLIQYNKTFGDKKKP